MLIPVGLLRTALRAGLDDHSEATGAMFENASRTIDFDDAMAAQQARARELWEACCGAGAGLLVLVGADWPNTELDYVRFGNVTAPATAADPLGPGPHGVVAVCPGRHKVSTNVGGHAVEADLVLFPGEALFRRLDRGARAWCSYDDATEQQLLARFAANQLSLVHYWEQIAEPRVRAMIGTSEAEATRTALGLLERALAAIVRGNQAGAMEAVTAITRTLIGAPVRSFAPLTSFLGFHAFELFAEERAHEAWLLLQAGLAILPDEPTLLAALGEIQLRTGKGDDGRAILARALARKEHLVPALHDRVRDLLARG